MINPEKPSWSTKPSSATHRIPVTKGSWMKGDVWGLVSKDKHPQSSSKIHDWLRGCGEMGFAGGGSVSYCGRAAQTLVPDTGTSARGNMADLRSERRGGWTGRGGGGSVHGFSLGVSRCSHTAVFAVLTATVDMGWHHAVVVTVEILKFSRCLDTGNSVCVTDLLCYWLKSVQITEEAFEFL